MKALPGLMAALVAVVAIALGKQPNGLAGVLYGWIDRWRAGGRVTTSEPVADDVEGTSTTGAPRAATHPEVAVGTT